MNRFAVIIILLLVLPVTVLARMDTLTEEDMVEVTGQTGITIDLTWQLLDSYLAWTDNDGFGTTASQTEGVITLSGLKINDGNASPGPITITGITLDVGTSGANTYLLLGMPAISGQVSIENFFIGSHVNSGGSLGRVYVGDLNMKNSVLRVTAH
ncbi:MAG: hypothetical protein JEZ02_19095 [Desulfatibacillum sp.]|nr:hypothetical protein [Desulfatibacillum sp.]